MSISLKKRILYAFANKHNSQSNLLYFSKEQLLAFQKCER